MSTALQIAWLALAEEDEGSILGEGTETEAWTGQQTSQGKGGVPMLRS